MISTLHRLVHKLEKNPCRSIDLLRRYNGDDWRQYIKFHFDHGCEISLSRTTPIYLVGLLKNQRYYMGCPSTIRMLEEKYYPDYKRSTNISNSIYSTIDMSGANYIIGKDYTSFLVVKHYYF